MTLHIISHERLTILVDMDGVLCDLYHAIHETLKQRHPELVIRDKSEQRQAYMSKEYPQYVRQIHDIYETEGFFLNLEPIEGAITAMHEIARKHNPIICTHPFENSKYCIPEKQQWLAKYIGKQFPAHFAFDKTYYMGYMIIDDNPVMKGDLLDTNPWEHVIFDAPYNRHIDHGRRINWSNYKEKLPELRL